MPVVQMVAVFNLPQSQASDGNVYPGTDRERRQIVVQNNVCAIKITPFCFISTPFNLSKLKTSILENFLT
jgi:hypothetical protein